MQPPACNAQPFLFSLFFPASTPLPPTLLAPNSSTPCLASLTSLSLCTSLSLLLLYYFLPHLTSHLPTVSCIAASRLPLRLLALHELVVQGRRSIPVSRIDLVFSSLLSVLSVSSSGLILYASTRRRRQQTPRQHNRQTNSLTVWYASVSRISPTSHFYSRLLFDLFCFSPFNTLIYLFGIFHIVDTLHIFGLLTAQLSATRRRHSTSGHTIRSFDIAITTPSRQQSMMSMLLQ